VLRTGLAACPFGKDLSPNAAPGSSSSRISLMLWLQFLSMPRTLPMYMSFIVHRTFEARATSKEKRRKSASEDLLKEGYRCVPVRKEIMTERVW